MVFTREQDKGLGATTYPVMSIGQVWPAVDAIGISYF